MAMRRRRGTGHDAQEAPELAALADGSLAPDRRAALEAKIAASPALAERLAEQQRALTLASDAAASVEAPPSLRARIEAHRSTQSSRRPRRLALAAVAAAAVVAVAVGVTVSVSDGSSAAFEAALAPTALAPDAGGRATFTKTASGWRIGLDASGLPRLAGGRFYQAWLADTAGVLVPVGTFNEGKSVTLWSGVSPQAFRTLTVTRERADGDQRSSGERVLAGAIHER